MTIQYRNIERAPKLATATFSGLCSKLVQKIHAEIRTRIHAGTLIMTTQYRNAGRTPKLDTATLSDLCSKHG